MPLQSWSRKIRQYDFTLPWAIQVGKDAESGVTGQLTVTVNNVSIKTSSISSSTEDTSVMFPADTDSGTGAGQIVRGLHKFNTPDASDANSFKQAFRITNSGANDLTIFNIFRSFVKMYPTEQLDSADTTGTDLTDQDKLDYADTYSSISTEGSANNLMYQAALEITANNPFPSNLTSAFSGLSSASTQSEIEAILTSDDFISHYGNLLPVPTLPTTVTILNSSKTSVVTLPTVLAPGDTIVVPLTQELTDQLTNPFKSPI